MANYRHLDEKEILSLKKKGYTHQQIADMLGVSRDTISRYLRKFKDEYADISEANRKHRTIHLTYEQVEFIKKLKLAGYSNNEIARRSGLSYTTVMKVLKGEKDYE